MISRTFKKTSDAMRPQPKEEEALWLRPCDGGGLKQTQRNKRVNKRAIYPS